MPATVKELLIDLPGLRWAARWRHDRLVAKGSPRRFWGLFHSFDEATAAAADHPSRLPAGYDRAEIAPKGRDIYERMYLHDYPALFWLEKLAGPRPTDGQGPRRVVDLGGHLGEKFRVFRRLNALEFDLEWVVLETPAVVEVARTLPDADRSGQLSFSADPAVLDGADIVFASGALQYLDRDLCAILDTLAHPPEHLVLNKVPLSDGPDVWTLQANGAVVVPYHVMNRTRFVESLAKRGYRVLDEWEAPEFRVRLPFDKHPGTRANSGLSLTRPLVERVPAAP